MSDIKKFEPAMDYAIAEACKWLGSTSPNPPVGAAALDKAGHIIATAAHRMAGGPHAEAALLEICRKEKLLEKIETICVTLEPCNHQGRTPPCTEALIAANIKRVVIGTQDPNRSVKGGGIERLRAAGIEVISSVRENACRELIHAFAYHAASGRPWITIKRAFNQAGSMIPEAGQKTFTSQESLKLAHALRKKADVILTGSGTILADKPLFTVRLLDDYKDKKRTLAILDRRKRVSKNYIEDAEKNGFHVIIYDHLERAIDDLNNKGARDILVEAGPLLSTSLENYAFWTMSVNIRAGQKDSVDVLFNPKTLIPFDKDQFSWGSFLPS